MSRVSVRMTAGIVVVLSIAAALVVLFGDFTPPVRSAGSTGPVVGETEPAEERAEQGVEATAPSTEKVVRAEEQVRWVILRNRSSSSKWQEPLSEPAWSDDRVQGWLGKNAVVIVLDMDSQRESAKALSIDDRAIIVAFKDDKEFDRIEAVQSPLSLVEWFEGLQRGERSVLKLVDPQYWAPAWSRNKSEVQSLLQVARGAEEAGDAGRAAECFVRVWTMILDRMPGTDWADRWMSESMQRLASTSPDSRVKFELVRDKIGSRLGGEKVLASELRGWVICNRVLDESSVTLEWFDRAKRDRRMRPLLDAVRYELADVLVAAGRWADLAEIALDPMDELESRRRLLAVTDAKYCDDPRHDAIMRVENKAFDSGWTEDMARIYAGLLAARREEQAGAFAAKARDLYGGPVMNIALVRWAMRAGEPRQEHAGWMAECGDDAVARALKEVLEERLKAPVTTPD